MADLSDTNASQSVKILGADSSGVEQTPVQSTAQGGLHSNLRNNAGTEIGTSANPIYERTNNISEASDLSRLVATDKLFSIGIEVNAASSGSNNPLVLIRNPIGSGKIIYVYKLLLGTDVSNIAIAGKIFANPTITTNGTAIPIGSRNVGSSPTPIALVTSLPTVSSSGTQLEAQMVGQNTNSIELCENFSIAIQPGCALLITARPPANNRNAVITFTWAEI